MTKHRFQNLLGRFQLAHITDTLVYSHTITLRVLDFLVNDVCFDLLLPSADLIPVCQPMGVCTSQHSDSSFASIDANPRLNLNRAASFYIHEWAPALRHFGQQWRSILSSFLVMLSPGSEVQVLSTAYECTERVADAANGILESFGASDRIQFVSEVDASASPPPGRAMPVDDSFLGHLETRLLLEVRSLMVRGCALLHHLLAQILPLLSEKMLQEWRLIVRACARCLCQCVNTILYAFAEDLVSPFASFSLQLVQCCHTHAADAESAPRAESTLTSESPHSHSSHGEVAASNGGSESD